MQQMFAQFQQTQAAGFLPKGTADWTPTGHPSQPNAVEAPERRHVIPFPGDGSTSDSTPPSPGSVEPGHWEAEELAARVDRFLVELPPRVLCRALGMVSTRQAFLVLCGLPNDTAETVLKMLPRRQARKVRNDMRKMGQLQLADIDAAKQVVTQLALQEGSQSDSVAA